MTKKETKVLTNEEDAYMLAQQHKYEQASNDAKASANNTYRDFSKQLILAGTIFLTLSFSFLGNNDFIGNMQPKLLKLFMASSWIILTMSIAFGVWQIYDEYTFFKKWAKMRNSFAKRIRENEVPYDNIERKEAEAHRELSNDAPFVFLKLQVVCLILGISISVGVLTYVFLK